MRPEPSFARSLVAFSNAWLRGEQPVGGFDGYARVTNWSRSVRFVDGERTFDDAASWLDPPPTERERGKWSDAIYRCIEEALVVTASG